VIGLTCAFADSSGRRAALAFVQFRGDWGGVKGVLPAQPTRHLEQSQVTLDGTPSRRDTWSRSRCYLEAGKVDYRVLEEQARFLRRIGEAWRSAADAATDFATALDAATSVPDEVNGLDIPVARGPRQQEIIEILSGISGEEGLKTADLGNRISMDSPNAYLTLQALQKQGLVELVAGVEPQHWRLAPKYRLSRKIIQVGGLVEAGEWTSYGDISQVVYGHFRGGLAVGQVVSRLPERDAWAHRVLLYTGQIPAEWRSDDGLGPTECARRLREEGVEVDSELFAHGRHHVTHEELSRRLGSAGTTRTTTEGE
jgi:alkylated DNA nucleotide flippase Atl1